MAIKEDEQLELASSSTLLAIEEVEATNFDFF